MQVLTALKAPIDWESFNLQDGSGPKKDKVPVDVKESIRRNGFALKGPVKAANTKGGVSADVMIAREFGLFAHVVPVKNVPTVVTRHNNVDIVIIRENTEGEYSGLEHEVNPGVVQSLKVITRQASRMIAEYAFQYAVENGRKKVTAVHKANIMKMADGLFLECCREVAGLYHNRVNYEEMIIDNCCMQLVSKPEQFDVVVTGNLYGNVVSEAAAGLVGGVGLVPGFNVGKAARIYEQGPRHVGNAIAGQNIANPTSFLLASALMLKDMGLPAYGKSVEDAVLKTITQHDKNVLTPDIVGCKGTTASFTQAVIDNLVKIE